MKKGWQRKQIGDLCEVIAGQSPEGKFYNADGKGMPFYQGKKNFGEKFIEATTTWTTRTTKIAKEGDILMSVRAPVGPVNFATDEVCIGRGLAAIRSRAELNRDFLFYQLWHLQPDIAGREGAVFASINKAEIEALPLAFAPLPEQQRIVGILDEAFAGLTAAKANAEKNLQNARDLFESHLQSIFTQHRKGWVEKTLADVCETTQGVQIPKNLHFKSPGENLRRYLYISDFESEKNVKYVEDIYPKKRVNENDLIVVNTGATAGKIFRGIDGVLSNNLFKVTLNQDINGDFLYYFVTSSLFKEHQKKIVKGTANPHMGHENFKSTPVNIPPLDVQLDTVAKLDELSDEIQRLESIYQSKLAALEELKKSLLHQAFMGQL